MKINLQPNDMYSQRNNKWDDPRTKIHESFIGCFPTSRAMFYRGNNIPFTNNSDLEDDDYLMKLLRSDAAYQYATIHWPKLVEFYPPNEIHYMYPEWLDLMVCGKTVSVFHDHGLTFEKAIELMDERKVIMVSGHFPEAKINGHMFCIIGYKDKNTLLLADPFGNFHTNYKDTKGYKVEMTKDEFNKYLKWGNTKGYHTPLQEDV